MREVPSDAVKYGLNRDLPHDGLEDDRYVRCKHCGFICHLDRDQRAPYGSKQGDGINHADVADYDASAVMYDGADDDWDNTRTYDGGMNDFKVVSGCPLCGALTYAE